MKVFDPIVLASSSPRRQRMFESLGLAFEVIPANIVEQQKNGEPPESFACRTAHEKGLEVAGRLGEQNRSPWIVSADTIVVLQGTVLGKPATEDDAKTMLMQLSGKTHTVITGWCIGRGESQWIREHTSTKVTFHLLSINHIKKYIATGEGMDKAGAYAIQGLGAILVDRIEGNFDNVVGLPISHVFNKLIALGALPEYRTP